MNQILSVLIGVLVGFLVTMFTHAYILRGVTNLLDEFRALVVRLEEAIKKL